MRFGMRHIRYFTAVAEDLHFRRAAARLNVAQPALSRAIQQLEREVGIQLLARSNRQVELTHAGAVFLKGCRTALGHLEGAVEQAHKAQDGTSGHLVIGYTDFAISGRLPQILQAFRQSYPDVTLEPNHGFTGTQLSDIENRKLDFGFLTGPIDRPDFGSRTIQTDRLVVVLYESHPLARHDEIPLSALAGEPFILGTPSGWKHYHDHLYRLCREHGFEPKVVQSAFNSEGIFGLIACKMGITVLTDSVRNYVRKGLVIRPLRDCEARVPTVAMWNAKAVTPVMARFIQFLERQEEQPQAQNSNVTPLG